MKKYFMLFVFVLSFVLCTGFSKRYYVETNSKAEAIEMAYSCGGKLESFSEGIGVIVVESKKEISNTPFVTARTEYVTKSKNSKLKQDHVVNMVGIDEIAPYTNEEYNNIVSNMKAIRWTDTYKNNITGKGVVVAVIDSGCDIKHEDLKGNIGGAYNATDGTINVTDVVGHGTHVSGIIAASDNSEGIVGVAPDAKLYIIKIMSDDGRMYYSSIIRALRKCVSMGNISVINMSFGGSYRDEEFAAAVKACDEAGILCVSAAGNNSTDTPMYPAAYGVGIRVASYDASSRTLSDFSNYGSANCDIAAPGDDIESTYPDDAYCDLSGTSMATPFVSGVAVLIYSDRQVSKNASGTAYVKNLILANNDGRTYKYENHVVKGGIDVKKIFKPEKLKAPDKPKITVKKQKDTLQQIVTIEGTGDIYYTIDGKDPSVYSPKYKTKLHIDTPGTHRVRAICANKRSYSYTVTKKVAVDDSVISQNTIKRTTLYLNDNKTVKAGKSYTVKIQNTTLTSDKFKWSTSDKTLATVDSKGKITVSKTARKGDAFTVSAKLGSITKKLNLTVK